LRWWRTRAGTARAGLGSPPSVGRLELLGYLVCGCELLPSVPSVQASVRHREGLLKATGGFVDRTRMRAARPFGRYHEGRPDYDGGGGLRKAALHLCLSPRAGAPGTATRFVPAVAVLVEADGLDGAAGGPHVFWRLSANAAAKPTAPLALEASATTAVVAAPNVIPALLARLEALGRLALLVVPSG